MFHQVEAVVGELGRACVCEEGGVRSCLFGAGLARLGRRSGMPEGISGDMQLGLWAAQTGMLERVCEV
jgi:hypothetical protein